MNKRKKFLGQYLIVGMFLSFLVMSLIGGFTTQIFKSVKYNNCLLYTSDAADEQYIV